MSGNNDSLPGEGLGKIVERMMKGGFQVIQHGDITVVRHPDPWPVSRGTLETMMPPRRLKGKVRVEVEQGYFLIEKGAMATGEINFPHEELYGELSRKRLHRNLDAQRRFLEAQANLADVEILTEVELCELNGVCTIMVVGADRGAWSFTPWERGTLG